MQPKSDEQIKHQVESELRWDTRTWNMDIAVSVTDAIVILSGSVPSYAHKAAAQEAAHRAAGVLDVANEITVKIPHDRSDEEIAQSVRKALEWDVLVPDSQIKSTVIDGWLLLEGAVNTLQQREDAAQAVKNIEGVTGVTNNLRIEAPKINTEDLRIKIEAALERRAMREADDFRIQILDGEVNLYGRVHSWQERRAVVGSVSHAPGVKKVNDNLRVDPYF